MADSYSLPPNHPSPAFQGNRAARRSKDGRDKAKAYQDPARKFGERSRGSEDHSWLGRWADVGWAIKIGRKLKDEEWSWFGLRAEETWDEELNGYSAEKSLALLGELFPGVALDLVWPKCAYRTLQPLSAGGHHLWVVCDNTAKHTETQARDVLGNRVAIARCERHRGQL